MGYELTGAQAPHSILGDCLGLVLHAPRHAHSAVAGAIGFGIKEFRLVILVVDVWFFRHFFLFFCFLKENMHFFLKKFGGVGKSSYICSVKERFLVFVPGGGFRNALLRSLFFY